MNLICRRGLELLAMMMIGEGMIIMMQPRRHMRLWRMGPPQLRDLVLEFERRPALSTAMGAAEAALGLWLASRVVEEE